MQWSIRCNRKSNKIKTSPFSAIYKARLKVGLFILHEVVFWTRWWENTGLPTNSIQCDEISSLRCHRLCSEYITCTSALRRNLATQLGAAKTKGPPNVSNSIRTMVDGAEFKSRSPFACDLCLCSQESDGRAGDDMLEPSNLRKRHQELAPLQLNEISQPLSKKLRLSHPSGSRPPTEFWNNLSKVWLTKRALRELDRRNTQAASRQQRPSYQQLHRPVTRRALAEWKKNKDNWQPAQTAEEFLSHCTTACLKDIKLFARHGGPDLSDLRGVCVARYLLVPLLTILSL